MVIITPRRLDQNEFREGRVPPAKNNTDRSLRIDQVAGAVASRTATSSASQPRNLS